MFNVVTQFGEAAQPSGIAALGINLKAFIFQLLTFVIVLLILRKWVFPTLVATIEARRETLEKSLLQAKETEEALRSAEAKAGDILQEARNQADTAMSDAASQAREVIAKAEGTASEHASRIIKEAEGSLEQEAQKLRSELRGELASLVAETTEKILKEKLDDRKDRALIEKQVKDLNL